MGMTWSWSTTEQDQVDNYVQAVCDKLAKVRILFPSA